METMPKVLNAESAEGNVANVEERYLRFWCPTVRSRMLNCKVFWNFVSNRDDAFLALALSLKRDLRRSPLKDDFRIDKCCRNVGSDSNDFLHCHLFHEMERITKLASQKAVVIFSKSSCGMSHAIKRLFYEQGVGPAIYELDEDTRGKEMEWALMRLGCNPSVPAVFVGGKFVGSANTVMTLHLNGSLKKMLRDAGALWL
ncbi:hypothetical protein VNO80_28953 [Phaseolus coccineus]